MNRSLNRNVEISLKSALNATQASVLSHQSTSGSLFLINLKISMKNRLSERTVVC